MVCVCVWVFSFVDQPKGVCVCILWLLCDHRGGVYNGEQMYYGGLDGGVAIRARENGGSGGTGMNVKH